MIESEHWLPVVGWEGFYDVSDLGRVRSIERIVKDKKLGHRKVRGRILKSAKYWGGYMYLSLWKNNCPSMRMVHGLVAEAFIGPRNGREVNHKDGVRHNNSLSNLEYVTHSENMIHSKVVLRTKIARGEQIRRSKLTASVVVECRALAASGVSIRELAKKFGTSGPGMNSAIHGRTWPHIPGAIPYVRGKRKGKARNGVSVTRQLIEPLSEE